MTKDNGKLDRREFLKRSTIATAGFTAGLGLKSTYASASKPEAPIDKTVNACSAKQIEILFLGTGAADWPNKYPPIEQKLEKGQVRGLSSILVNDHILVDCGPTVIDAMKRFGVDPAGITDILLTHTHSDHFRENTILAIANARSADLGPLRFWAHPEALKYAPKSDRLKMCPVEIGKIFELGGFRITGLESNHLVESSKEKPLYYLLENDTKQFLYATDGAWLLKSTWVHLRNKKLDAIIWDATVGERKGDSRIFEHNDLTMIRHMNRTLKNMKVIKPDSKIILTHMARTLHPSHHQLEKNLLPQGLIPAYDGMLVDLSNPVGAVSPDN